MNISIVGGGATGAAVLIALIREIEHCAPNNKIDIQIFEPDELGAGVPYSVQDHCFLLNTSVCTTSIIHNNNSHFLNWLDKNKEQWGKLYPEITTYDENSFIPRSLCGTYIKDTLDKTIKSIKKSKVHIIHVKKNVTDIQYHHTQHLFAIKTDNETYKSQYCILCTGYLNGTSKTYHHLLGTAHYYSSPYSCSEEIKKIPPSKSILILGTRLSAIDAALLLKKHHHIAMASRSGFLPAVRNRVKITTAKYLTDAHQETFFNENKSNLSLELIKKEIEQELSFVYRQPINLSLLQQKQSSTRQLKEDLKIAQRQLNLWEDSIMTILKFINNAWTYLSLSDKKSILQNEIQLIQRFISSFPRENAFVIYSLIKKGQLTLKKGLKDIEPQGTKYIATFHEENKDYEEEYEYIINATPIDNNLRHSPPELYKKLITKNIIQINHFGGIKVNKYYQIKINHVAKRKMYAAGPIIKGSVLTTNLLISSAQQADIIAKQLCKKWREE